MFRHNMKFNFGLLLFKRSVSLRRGNGRGLITHENWVSSVVGSRLSRAMGRAAWARIDNGASKRAAAAVAAAAAALETSET